MDLAEISSEMAKISVRLGFFGFWREVTNLPVVFGFWRPRSAVDRHQRRVGQLSGRIGRVGRVTILLDTPTITYAYFFFVSFLFFGFF